MIGILGLQSLELNVTKSFFDKIKQTSDSWTKKFLSKSKSLLRPQFDSYIICNDTGTRIK